MQPFPDAQEGRETGAAELGIVEGVGGGLFEPEQPATRAEVAAMMVQLYDLLKK